MKVSFNGVEQPKDTVRVVKVIEPGVQQLRVVNMEDKTAATGTAYVEVEFNRPDNSAEYTLKERFFLTAKTLWRFQLFLAEALNRSFEGVDIDTSELKGELIGKVNTYVVNGEEFMGFDKEQNPTVKTRSRLAFSNFINPPAGTSHWISRLPKEEATSAPSADINTSTSTPDDLPF